MRALTGPILAAAVIVFPVSVGIATTAGAATFYLCSPPAARTLCTEPPGGEEFYQDNWLSGSRSYTLPDVIDGDIAGTTYAFHIFLSSSSSTSFLAEILVNGDVVASMMLSSTTTFFQSEGGEVTGIDPAVIGAAPVTFRITHMGGGFGRILWGDFGQDDSYIRLPDATTSTVPPPAPLPQQAALAPPAPNPSGGSTGIAYELPVARTVRLRVLDVHGRVVRDLVAGVEQSRGSHAVPWDGCDRDGHPVEDGFYFVQLQAGADVAVRKLLLAR